MDKNYPNPFNPSTRINFTAPRKGHLSIKVYNIRGELVRTLVDGQVPAGAGHVVWDGRDHGGAGVASGIYLYQVKGFGENVTEKMALVK